VSVLLLAEKAKRSLEGASEGGRKSATTRLQNATWIPIAKPIAIDVRRERPDASQSTVADEIGFRWKDDEVDCPEHRALSPQSSRSTGY
jgi:hypothetical protein